MSSQNNTCFPLFQCYIFLIVALILLLALSSGETSQRVYVIVPYDAPVEQTSPPVSAPTVSAPPSAPTVHPAASAPTVQATAIPAIGMQGSDPLNGLSYDERAAEFMRSYGDRLYATFEDVPQDLRRYYLYICVQVERFYGVPCEAILAVHFAELMGGGFRPLETRVSRAGARGPGQVTPGYWNGWYSGNVRSFRTLPVSHPGLDATSIMANIQYGGCGFDFDRDGDADPDSLVDNMAGTACGLLHSGVTVALRNNTPALSAALREALAVYNSGDSYGSAPQITRQYAEIGVAWIEANAAIIRAAIAAEFPSLRDHSD